MEKVDAKSFEIKDFQKDIIDASIEKPVLVDFWAEWCGPCRFVGPILEKLAMEEDAPFNLVKINTEANPEISEQWEIRGIPNIKMFFNGAVIGELAGALPEDEMRKWIEQNLPSKAKELMMNAQEEMAKGNDEEAIKLLEESIQENPELFESQLLLAYQLLWINPLRSKLILEKSLHIDSAVLISILADINLTQEDMMDNGYEAKDSLWRGIHAFQNKDYEPAILEMIESLKIDKTYMTELARKNIVAIFAYLGPEDELVKKHRPTFDMTLY